MTGRESVAPGPGPALEARHLRREFFQGGERIRALDDVSLRVDRSDFLCLSGPSGSGKTTLLNVLGALDAPDAGSVFIDGRKLSGLGSAGRAALRRCRIGFVFQAYNLVPVLSARENIEFVMQLQGVPAAERRRRSERILEEVGLGGLGGRRPAELSGGQQQRVAVARAVVSEPAVVLADEPTANLDSASAAQLMELCLRLNGERGMTFVIATHDPKVMGCARRLVSMHDGRIAGDRRQAPVPMAT